MKWTDENIDKLFQQNAEKASFAYSPEYWEEFSASLSEKPNLTDLNDAELDALFKNSADSIAVAYNTDFWEEFSASLPIMMATEEVTDGEVDALYRKSAAELSFDYKTSYWDEMLALLNRRRRPDFLWFGLSGFFATLLVGGIIFRQDVVQETPTTAAKSSVVKPVQLTDNSTDGGSKEGNKTDVKSDNKANAVGFDGTIGTNSSSGNTNTQGTTQTKGQRSTQGTNSGGAIKPVEQRGGSIVAVQTIPGQTEANPNPVKRIALNKLPISPRLMQLPTRLATRQTAQREFDPSFPSQLNPLKANELAFNLSDGELVATPMPIAPQAKGDASVQPYVQGIFGISQSLITPSEHNSYSYGLGMGVSMYKRNFTYSCGMNVLIENYKDLHLSRTAKVYGFGSELHRYDLYYKQLYAAELDLSVGYNFNRHRFNFGLRPSFIFGSLVDIDQSSLSTLNGEMIESSTVRVSNYGFMEGVKRFGIRPSIGYSYTFRGNITLGFNFGMELLPSINQEFINGVNNKLPLDGQLYLRKNLTFKK